MLEGVPGEELRLRCSQVSNKHAPGGDHAPLLLDSLDPCVVSFLRSAGQLSTSNESSAPAGESYEGSHDGGGVAQSLDGGVRPLLEVVVVAGHVEGGEGRPAALHGSGQRARRQRHAQPAVGGQRALDGVGQ